LARVKFLLAHLSDPHVGPLPRPRRHELIGKRVTGYLNWTRSRSRIHDMTVLEQIVTDMKAHHPSHVAMTGDIANLGLPAEFQLARNWLETLGAPEDVSFVPGNHDAYVRGSLPHLARTFAPWTTGRRAPARVSLICGSGARLPWLACHRGFRRHCSLRRDIWAAANYKPPRGFLSKPAGAGSSAS